MINGIPEPSELTEIERKAIELWGGDPTDPEDIKDFFDLSVLAKGRYKSAAFDGHAVDPEKKQRRKRQKDRKHNQRDYSYLKKVTRGEKKEESCENCDEIMTVFACIHKKWCEKCLVEIKRLRSRLRWWKLRPEKKGLKPNNIIPIKRLTKKTLTKLGLTEAVYQRDGVKDVD